MGTVGVILGLNLDPRVLRLLPRPVYSAALAHAGSGLSLRGGAAGGGAVTPHRRCGRGSGGAMCSARRRACPPGTSRCWATAAGGWSAWRGLGVALLTMLDDGVGLVVLALALVLGAAANPGRALGLVVPGAAAGRAVWRADRLPHVLAEGARGADGGDCWAGWRWWRGAAAYLRLSVAAGGRGVRRDAGAGGRPARRSGWRARSPRLRAAQRTWSWCSWSGCHAARPGPAGVGCCRAFVALRFLGKVWAGALAQRLAAKARWSCRPRLGYALSRRAGWRSAWSPST